MKKLDLTLASRFLLALLLLCTTWAVAGEDAPKLLHVKHAVVSPTTEQVVLQFNGSYSPKIFTLKDEKPRIVLDFSEMGIGGTVQSVTAGHGSLVKRIRTGVHSGEGAKTRVVLDLATLKGVTYSHHFDEKTSSLVLDITAPKSVMTGLQKPAPAKVAAAPAKSAGKEAVPLLAEDSVPQAAASSEPAPPPQPTQAAKKEESATAKAAAPVLPPSQATQALQPPPPPKEEAAAAKPAPVPPPPVQQPPPPQKSENAAAPVPPPPQATQAPQPPPPPKEEAAAAKPASVTPPPPATTQSAQAQLPPPPAKGENTTVKSVPAPAPAAMPPVPASPAPKPAESKEPLPAPAADKSPSGDSVKAAVAEKSAPPQEPAQAKPGPIQAKAGESGQPAANVPTPAKNVPPESRAESAKPAAGKSDAVIESSQQAAQLEDVRFEGSSPKGEMVLFKLNGFHPPAVHGAEEGIPRVICDFNNTKLTGSFKNLIKTTGKFVKIIRTTKSKKPEKVRVVIDLEPNHSYDLQQVFFKDDNLFVIIVNTIKN